MHLQLTTSTEHCLRQDQLQAKVFCDVSLNAAWHSQHIGYRFNRDSNHRGTGCSIPCCAPSHFIHPLCAHATVLSSPLDDRLLRDRLVALRRASSCVHVSDTGCPSRMRVTSFLICRARPSMIEELHGGYACMTSYADVTLVMHGSSMHGMMDKTTPKALYNVITSDLICAEQTLSLLHRLFAVAVACSFLPSHRGEFPKARQSRAGKVPRHRRFW
jgi:hypothetical protein